MRGASQPVVARDAAMPPDQWGESRKSLAPAARLDGIRLAGVRAIPLVTSFFCAAVQFCSVRFGLVSHRGGATLKEQFTSPAGKRSVVR